MKKKTKKYYLGLPPVKITDDVWFYVNEKSFDFVVWSGMPGEKTVSQFRVLKSKIKKSL